MTFMNTKQDNTAEIGIAQRTGPLHKWLADEIRSKVIRGDITPDQPLETEAELAQRYQVSRGTVRQAMTTLVNEGLIDRQAGRGSFVREPAVRQAAQISNNHSQWAGNTPKISRIRVLVDCAIQPPPDSFVMFQCIEGLSLAATQMNGSCKLTYEYHRIEHAKDPVAIRFMEQDDCEGMVVIPITQQCIDFLEQMGKPAKPTAVLYRRISNPHIHRFAIDNHFGAYQATDYLLRLGHRRIAMLILTWPDSWPSTLERLDGYRQAMQQAGCDDPSLVASANTSYNSNEIHAACKQLFSGPNRPTAFLVNNMANLEPALEALSQMNLRVPEDVSLIGFDESDTAKKHNPPVGVIHMPLADHAKNAMEHLHKVILNHEPPGPEQLITPELRLRKSCLPRIELTELPKEIDDKT